MEIDIEDIRDTYGCDKKTAREIKKMIKDLEKTGKGEIEEEGVSF